MKAKKRNYAHTHKCVACGKITESTKARCPTCYEIWKAESADARDVEAGARFFWSRPYRQGMEPTLPAGDNNFLFA